jgi:DNA repair protein RadC
MVVKVRLANGRETWLDPTNPETIRAVENQYGSKVVLIDGKAYNKATYGKATKKAEHGAKVGENGGFVKDEQGNYKNSKGFELINQFDGTYQVLDKNGMDISGEYETLQQAKQTIEDFELFENQDQTMNTGGRFDKVKQMALLTMKPFAFKQKAQFLKENPEMLAGKFFDNGGGVGIVKKDRYGNEVTIGDAIHIRVLTGRYGQTKDYEGIVTNFDQFGNVELDGQRSVSYTADYKYNDYEHGHYIWVEKINAKDIKENLRVPKKFVPTFSSQDKVYGEDVKFTGTEIELKEFLKNKYPNSVWGQWNPLFNKGWRYNNGKYISPDGQEYDSFGFYQSVEQGQGYLNMLMIPKKYANGGLTMKNDGTPDNSDINKRHLKKVVFKNKNRPKVVIEVLKTTSGRIVEINNQFKVKFPYRVGQTLDMGHQTWACNNGFFVNDQNTCAEKKIFGIKPSDIPQGHELRMLYPKKFRKKNGGLTMKTGGVTNEPLYNVVEKTPHATKVSATPDMYSNLTKQGVIDLSNTMSYYERMDNDELEITTFEKAKKFIELEGDWKVVKIAKHGTGTETSEVRFLSKDHSGRGERPYILNESHIRKTWDLKEVGDDDETSLGDFLDNSEPGDKWQSGTESLENLGIGMALGGYTLTKYTKEQEKLLKELDKKFRTEEPGSKERMEILQQMHNVQRMEHGGSFETEQEPGKYIFKDTEKAMLKNAFLFLKNATQTDDYFVIELSHDGHEYMVDWFALDGTDEGSVGYFRQYDNALKKFNAIREYIKSNWNIVAEKIDVLYEKNESNGEVRYDAPDVMELIDKASKGFKFQPWLYGKRGVKADNFPKVQYKGDSRAFYYVVGEVGNDYILVFEEKLDHWKNAKNKIERREFYEEIDAKDNFEPYKSTPQAKQGSKTGSLESWYGNKFNAMKQGGKLKPYADLSRKEPMVIKDDLFDTFTPEKPTLIKEKKSKKDTGTLTNIIPQVELVRMGVQTLENIGDRKITDSKSATKILYKVFPKNQIGVQEFYYALYTDRANNVIAYYNLSKGGVSGTIADAELVGSVGIKLLAQGVLVAHNHPSGNLKPSEADIKMALHTKQVLKGLGIELLDSIIIVPGGEPVDKFEGYKYTSLQDEGKI